MLGRRRCSRTRGRSGLRRERFGQYMPVARCERHAAKSGQRRRNVGRSDFAEIFSGLNAETHQKNGHVLVVVVRAAVAGAGGIRIWRLRSLDEPVGLRNEVKVAAASGKKTSS